MPGTDGTQVPTRRTFHISSSGFFEIILDGMCPDPTRCVPLSPWCSLEGASMGLETATWCSHSHPHATSSSSHLLFCPFLSLSLSFSSLSISLCLLHFPITAYTPAHVSLGKFPIYPFIFIFGTHPGIALGVPHALC